MKTKSLYTQLVISLFLVMLIPFYSFALNKESLVKKILCISSYGPDNHYVQEELFSFVRDAGRDDTSFMPVFELMDCRSLNNVSLWQESMQRILQRHQDSEVIILLGNEAAITYFSMPDEKFREIPLYVLQCNNKIS